MKKRSKELMNSLPRDIDNSDLEYFETFHLSEILSDAFTEINDVNPSDPTEYLARWLLNYESKNKLKTTLNSKKKYASDLQHKKENEINQKILNENKLKEEKELIEENIKNFKKKIEESEDHFENLNQFCDFLKEHTKATGVYIGRVERKKKKIGEDDNDLAHIDESQPLIINYVAACHDHSFMIDKKVNVEDGITNNVFKSNEEAAQESPPDGEGKAENQELPESEAPTGELFIPEVVREPKIKYFRVPRLGCYFVVALTYDSHLFEGALDKASENFFITKQKKEEQEKAKEEKEADLERERAEKEAAGESYTKPQVEWENIVEPPYESFQEKYVICLDTLGQDREFSEEEKKFVHDIVKFYSINWESRERKQLEIDKMKKVEASIENNEFKETQYNETMEKINNNAKTDMGNSELNITEETTEFYTLYFQSKSLCAYLTSSPMKEKLLTLKDYKIIKYPKVIQMLFYLLGKNKDDLCEPDTNKLKWKKAKEFLNENLLEEFQKYTPLGSKEGIPPRYRLLNNIEKMLEDYTNIEEIEKYSIVISLLLKWVKDIINVRKQDILMRKQTRETLRAERKQAIENEEERKKKREEALHAAIEEAKANWKPEGEGKEENPEDEKEDDDLFTFMEEPEVVKKEENEEDKKEEFTFDNEEFLKNWDEENPEIEIPPEVIEEKDDDYELPPPAS